MNKRLAVLSAVAVSAIVPLGFLPTLKAQQRQPAPERLVRYAARGTKYAVAAGTDFATNAGSKMMEQGGNAVDAGVAGIFAAATTEYSHVGWGGEAPILIRTKDGKVHALAGVGPMPKLASAEFFRSA